MNRRTISEAEWLAEGKSLFPGKSMKEWIFVCPRCKTPQSGTDFEKAGMDYETASKYIAFSCIGRFVRGKGCDWTLGGFLHIHTLEVIVEETGSHQSLFEFQKPGETAKKKKGKKIV